MTGRVRQGYESLPKVLTFGNLLCGLAAILFAVERQFLPATLLIFFAGFFDFLDGVLARLLRGEDAYGAALDALADIISFGVAPALLVYEAFLHPWPILGWAVAGGYVVCGAWRLARFAAAEKLPYFQGLPITMAAISVTSLLYYHALWSPRVIALATLICAVLMVSQVRFPKLSTLLRPLPFPVRLLLVPVLGVAAFVISPMAVMIALGAIYYLAALLDNLGLWEAAATGPVGEMMTRLRNVVK